MRRLWIGLGILVGVLLLLVVGALIALRSIDWNSYKEPLATAVHDATGRELDLSGDISLAIGLLPGVALNDVRFENAEWGSLPSMAAVDRLVVRMRLIPLIFGEIDLVLIEIDGLDVLLETNAAGETNWTFESDEDADTAETEPTPPEEGEAPRGQLIREVRRVVVRDARIVVLDEVADTARTIHIENLQLDQAGKADQADLQLEARYDAEHLRLDGEVTKISAMLGGAPLEFDLVLGAGGATTTTQGRVDLSADPLGLEIRLQVEGDDLAGWNALSGGELPSLGPYRLSLRTSGTGDRLQIRDLDLALGRSDLSGEVDLILSGERPRVDARLRSKLIDLADLDDSTASSSESASPDSAGSAPGESTSPPVEEDGRALPDDPLPIDALSALDGHVALVVERLETGSADVTNLDLGIDLDDRRLRLDPLSLETAGGSMSLTLGLDAKRSPPLLELKGDIEKIVLEQLVRIGGSEVIEDGMMDLHLDLRGRGRSVAAIAADLEGSFLLDLGEARVASQWAGIALADFREVLLGRDDAQSGRVTCVLADLEFEKGVGRPKMLVADLRSVVLFGTGSIDLGEEKLRLRFDREAKEISASQALPPFEIRGTFSDPSVRVDPMRLVGRVADLGVDVLDGDLLLSRKEWPEGCRNLIAAYEKAKLEPSKARKVTVDSGKQAVDALKGLLGR